MSNHIRFESMSCRDLQYVPESRSWVCLKNFYDLKCVKTCVECKFKAQLKYERYLTRKG